MDDLTLGGAGTLHRTVAYFSVPSRTSGTRDSGCGRIIGLASAGAINSKKAHRRAKKPG